METSHFYSIWQMSRPQNTRISFLHKTFQKTLKNIRIRILYPIKYDEHTYHFAMEVLPPLGAKINYSYAEALLFVGLKGCSPQLEVKSRKKKENGISHLRENGSHSSDKGNSHIKTNLHTGCLRKIAKKRGTQISS